MKVPSKSATLAVGEGISNSKSGAGSAAEGATESLLNFALNLTSLLLLRSPVSHSPIRSRQGRKQKSIHLAAGNCHKHGSVKNAAAMAMI
ncbi:uncharacterized protein Dsimw501_GD28794 [Drosophila simulans]|nr:uncharacterized protein Dsimw501_GD28794 [Drosophila simulans]